MAGLDYSQVREPELKPELLRMSNEVTNKVHEVVDNLQKIWANRKEVAQKRKAEAGPYYVNEKRIYYDTDQIEEQQEEIVKMCPDCAGYIKINSKAERTWAGQEIIGVSIPLYACTSCQQEGREVFYKAKAEASKMLDGVFLQDKPADEFIQWYPSRGEEKRY
jgi:hypothetical protein